jgi:hypothetical protein
MFVLLIVEDSFVYVNKYWSFMYSYFLEVVLCLIIYLLYWLCFPSSDI